MLGRLASAERRRRRLLARVPEGPLRHYLEQPLPDLRRPVQETEFLALDFETTGLDARRDAILSAGYTLVRAGRVVLAESGHHLVRVRRELPQQSVVVHTITDDRMRQGMQLHELMEILLERLAGRVLLVHYARVEQRFLDTACRRLYGHPLPMRLVDTMALARRRLEQRHLPIPPGALRLFNLRREYGLPRYRAHSALEDAIATAELFLAQVAHLGNGKPIPLKKVLLRPPLALF